MTEVNIEIGNNLGWTLIGLGSMSAVVLLIAIRNVKDCGKFLEGLWRETLEVLLNRGDDE